MKKFLIGLTCAAVLAIGANTIFPPIEANAATIKAATIIPPSGSTTIKSLASDPYDPIP